ncbi:hypothetical protein SAMN04487764_1262 [Gillisia sp. Hel1_33_143]|uniref:hypothetical protein n=1 Tax=Gillisia sp. Hel1_33_143 TaxID=1336796 RepID=UPI00087C7F7E|nr:hypothetical protein [Gillisia sp. Hel1_33_143]SDS02239.1 hypothetical protein SAMN04487764_1262 [Gillisia sp. Hel1_33_143]
MIRKQVLTGLLVGILATIIGIFLYISLFSELDIKTTLIEAANNDYLGKVIALGAALNFIPFFIFIKKNEIYKARGVLLATVLVAVIIAITKIL